MTRDYILLYINGLRHEVRAGDAALNLSEYLREKLNMKGTKVVCSEGDCGACSVLMYRYRCGHEGFVSVNACIAPLYLLDCCHIVTVEGVRAGEALHPVQAALAEHHGTQCGFCTPGFVNSMVYMCDELARKNRPIDAQQVRNYTTGNLCRCTGYKGIIEAGLALDLEGYTPLSERYRTEEIAADFEARYAQEVALKDGERELILPKTVAEAVRLKKAGYTVISGGTDIAVFVNKGFNKATKFAALTNIETLYRIEEGDGALRVGAMVSLSRVEQACERSFPVFSDALKRFASPQIKNKGTLVGNVANGSPIGDSIPFLYVSDAVVGIASAGGVREVVLHDFYLGYKQFDLKEDEIITHITIPKKRAEYRFYKVSARKDLDISAVSLAISYVIEAGIVKAISIAYGGVAATVYKAGELEAFLIGKALTRERVAEAAGMIPAIFTPFSDHRGSRAYRLKLCENLLLKFYNEVALESEVG